MNSVVVVDQASNRFACLDPTHCSSPLHVFGGPISGKVWGKRSLDCSSRGWDVRFVVVMNVCR